MYRVIQPIVIPPPGSAQFAINAVGELGIEKNDTKIALTAAEFSVLRAFIDKTEEVWK